jgi:predicted ABC-type exoprotein transport system permease subunit
VGWFFLGVIACVLFSLLFHKVWFVWLSWEVLHIPMGLGGAIYYIFFIGPVLVGSLLYQAAAQVILFRAKAPLRYRFVISFLVPFAVIAGLLIMNCPMEGEQSYTRAFLSTLFGRSRP